MNRTFWWLEGVGTVPATRKQLAQGEESRLRLLDAVERLVGGGGYSAASVDRIAREAGVVKSALYWHFGSKNGLLLAAMRHHTSLWVDDLRAAVTSLGTPVERLEKMLEHVRAVIVERPRKRRLVFALLIERAHDDEDYRQAIAELFSEMRETLAQGFAEVVPVPIARLRLMTSALVSLLDGVFLRYQIDPDADRLAEELREARRIVLLRVAHELQRAQKRGGEP